MSLPNWRQMCDHLDNNYEISELRIIVEKIIGEDDISRLNNLNKQQLCEIISNDYEDYKFEKYAVNKNCSNNGIIEDDYENVPESKLVTFTEGGKTYCFTLQEFAGILSQGRRNPFTRGIIPEQAIKQYVRKEKKLAPAMDKMRARQRLQEKLKGN